MDKSTIQTLIDKVIGKKGLIRVPSWWMRKVLMQIADWVQEGDDANDKKIVKVKKETDAKISTLNNLSLPYMLVSGTGIVNIGGKEIYFTNANKQLIYITGAVKFKKNDNDTNSNIIYIYIPHLDIRQGSDMSYMFYNCTGLTSLDLSSLDTSAVTSMSSIFNHCRGLTSLDLTGLDTSKVTDMSYMFAYCLGLTSLDLSNFDTSKVTDMKSMFYYCPAITSLLLGPNFFKTPNVTSVDFSYCTKWTNNTVATSLVTNSYDRATARLSTMTLKLSANTKAALTDEQKTTITAKGYTIA